MKPFISIIVPIYNTEKYLAKCISSLIEQTYENYEIILVNDGSSDNSGQICDEFKLKNDRIKVVHKEHEGVSSARNIGIETAQGDYICFVDSDDWVGTNFLMNFSKNIEEDSTFLVQDFHKVINGNINNQPTLNIENKTFTLNDNCINTMLKENRLYLSIGLVFNKLYSNNIIQRYNLRFDSSLHFAEDDRWNLEYFKYISKIKFIKDSEYYYRIRPNSLTNTASSIDMEIQRFITKASFITLLDEKFGLKHCSQKILTQHLSDFFELLIISIYKKKHHTINEKKKTNV